MAPYTWQHSFLRRTGLVSSPDFVVSPHDELVVRGSRSNLTPLTVTRITPLVDADDLDANSLTVWMAVSSWVFTFGTDTRVAYSFHPDRRDAAVADVEHWCTCGGFAEAGKSCPRCDDYVFSGKKKLGWSPHETKIEGLLLMGHAAVQEPEEFEESETENSAGGSLELEEELQEDGGAHKRAKVDAEVKVKLREAAQAAAAVRKAGIAAAEASATDAEKQLQKAEQKKQRLEECMQELREKAEHKRAVAAALREQQG